MPADDVADVTSHRESHGAHCALGTFMCPGHTIYLVSSGSNETSIFMLYNGRDDKNGKESSELVVASLERTKTPHEMGDMDDVPLELRQMRLQAAADMIASYDPRDRQWVCGCGCPDGAAAHSLQRTAKCEPSEHAAQQWYSTHQMRPMPMQVPIQVPFDAVLR